MDLFLVQALLDRRIEDAEVARFGEALDKTERVGVGTLMCNVLGNPLSSDEDAPEASATVRAFLTTQLMAETAAEAVTVLGDVIREVFGESLGAREIRVSRLAHRRTTIPQPPV